MRRLIAVGTLFLGLAAPLTAALPPGPSAVGTSQETVPTKKFSIDWFGWSFSNAFSNFNGHVPKVDGTMGDPIQIANQLQLQTPAFGNMNFLVMPQFVLQPGEGQRLQFWDPIVGIQGSIVEAGGYSQWARFGLAVPLTDGSRTDGLITSAVTVQSLNYKFPGTKLRVELSIVPELKFYANGQLGAFLYFSPRAYYEMTQSFWIMGIMETRNEIKKGAAFSSFGPTSPVNIGAGVRYTSLNGKGLWVQPFFDIYPASADVLSTAHLGVIFGGPLL